MKLSNETQVGLLVFFVIVIVVTMTIWTGEIKFTKEGYGIKVLFRNIDGVDINAPVMLNGFEQGLVKDIAISDNGEEIMMELSVWLNEGVKLREGAKAYVKNMGFMGEKYVGLTAGNKGGVVLPPGAVIVGEDPADLDTLLKDGQVIATNIKEISININERLTKNEAAIDNIVTNFDQSMENIVSITDNVDERLKINEGNIDAILENLHSSSINLDQFSYDLKLNPWKLMYRSKEQRRANIEEGRRRDKEKLEK